MKKIIVEKDEGIAELIEAMLNVADNELTFVIPNGSELERSVRNFHLLKREADAAGKSVSVESVDETILAFAEESGLSGNHPLWRGVRGAGGISDIIPADRELGVGAEPEKPKAPKRTRRKKVEPVKLTVREEKDEEETSEAEESQIEERENNVQPEAGVRGSRRYLRSKAVWLGAAAVVLLIIIFSVITWSFGHAAIAIEFKKTPWDYQGTFLADKAVSKMNATNGTIPAQVFTTKKNTTQSFPASGSANVSIKARGTITIYNAYSSAAQQLVATTRFVTPTGKILRIVNTVTVPGAKITDGQIVPSSLDTEIVADQAGPDYNLGPVDKLTIPGFQGSPKYNAFYGKISGTTTGGYTGKRAVPIAADITNARAKTTEVLQNNLKSNLTTSYPNNFKILDGATSVSVTKLTVNTTTDDGGNFSVFGEATLQAVGFDETKFKDFLLSLADSQKKNSVFDSLNLKYGGVHPDFTRGTLAFSLTADGAIKPNFSPEDFGSSVVGKGIGDVRAAIAALPDLADGKISVWPSWLWRMPASADKISVSWN